MGPLGNLLGFVEVYQRQVLRRPQPSPNDKFPPGNCHRMSPRLGERQVWVRRIMLTC